MMKFVITESAGELTWDEWIALETQNNAKMKAIMARFLVDENDRPIAYEQALKTLGSVKLKDLAEVTGAFWRAMRDNATNPQTGSKS